jgi:hypothetical protein
MNERILQLAKQAGLKFPSEEALSPVEIKFAELIVRECMRLNSKELSITAIERLLPVYAEHFGVEE